MNIKVFQNRKIERDYFYNEGTQNENNITVLTFEVPLGYEDFSKRIVFITEDGNFWDYIPENQYELKNNITKYGKVEAYLWLTKDEQDFRSETFELNFFKNENADDLIPTEEQLDGFNTLIAELEVTIEEVDNLKKETLKALEDLKEKQIDYENKFKEIDDMIKEIQETNEYQSEIIDQFKNEFKQITVSGDSIHITDAAELPIDLVPYGEPTQVVIPEELGTTVEGESVVVSDGDVDKEVKATVNGNTKQETTEGYNKFNIYTNTRKPGFIYTEGGITFTYKENGVINLKGTSTKQVDFYARGTWGDDHNEIIFTLKAGGNSAYLSDDINNKVSMHLIKRINGVSSAIASTMSKGTFNLTEDTNVIAVMLRVPINTTLDIDLEPMVYEGTNDKPFEPFTNGVATPNPNHKQDIEVIEAYNKVDFSTKYQNNSTFEGVTITHNDDKTFMLDGTSTGSKTIRLSDIMTDKLKANTTYTMFVEILSGSIEGGNFSSLIQASGTQLAGISMNKSTTYQFTPTEDITEWNYAVYYSASRIFTKLKLRVMVVKGAYSSIKDLPWLPYGHIGLVHRGKNRVNFSKPSSRGANTTYSFENDTLNISSTGGYRFLSYNITDLYKNNNGKQIKFVSKDIIKNENAKIGVQLNIVNTDGTKNYLYLMDSSGNNIIRTISNDTSNIQEVILGVYSNNSGNDVEATVTIAEPMLLIGDVTSTLYEPYIEPKTIPINLAGHKLAKSNDTIRDLLNIKTNGEVSLTKRLLLYMVKILVLEMLQV